MPTTPFLRVLVLDDDPRVRAALCRLLEVTPGVRVVPLGSAADVALVDVDLPDRASARARVRALAGGVPVVALGPDGAARDAALAAGAAAFVAKDGAASALLPALLAALPAPAAGKLP
jgi:DNA-binding NarL/FixJ family response regulator